MLEAQIWKAKHWLFKPDAVVVQFLNINWLARDQFAIKVSANTHSIHKKHIFCYYSKIRKIIRKPLSYGDFLIFLKYSDTCETDGAKKKFS